MPALKLEKICKSFGKVEVLSDIDLTVEDGGVTLTFNADRTVTVTGATVDLANNGTFSQITSIKTGTGLDTFIFDDGIFDGGP